LSSTSPHRNKSSGLRSGEWGDQMCSVLNEILPCRRTSLPCQCLCESVCSALCKDKISCATTGSERWSCAKTKFLWAPVRGSSWTLSDINYLTASMFSSECPVFFLPGFLRLWTVPSFLELLDIVKNTVLAVIRSLWNVCEQLNLDHILLIKVPLHHFTSLLCCVWHIYSGLMKLGGNNFQTCLNLNLKKEIIITINNVQ